MYIGALTELVREIIYSSITISVEAADEMVFVPHMLQFQLLCGVALLHRSQCLHIRVVLGFCKLDLFVGFLQRLMMLISLSDSCIERLSLAFNKVGAWGIVYLLFKICDSIVSGSDCRPCIAASGL